MYSKTCEYAIKVMVFVSLNTQLNIKVGVEDVAAEVEAKIPYIRNILNYLKSKNFVQYDKGYFLNEENLQLSIADIVIAIDGDRIFTNCCLGIKECTELNTCPLHYEMKSIKDELLMMMKVCKLNGFKDFGILKNIALDPD